MKFIIINSDKHNYGGREVPQSGVCQVETEDGCVGKRPGSNTANKETAVRVWSPEHSEHWRQGKIRVPAQLGM